MVRMRHSLWILGLFVVVIMAACGSNAGTGSSGSSGSANTNSTGTPASAGSTPTTSGTGAGCGRYCTSSTPTSASSGSGLIIKTATATVNSKPVTLLTNAQGMTLYYRTSDTNASVCSGGCASAWPPLLASGSTAPTSSTSLTGTLSVTQNANGSQVEYNGHPLYTFSGDSGPGQTNGEGIANIWFVVTSDLPAGNSSSTNNGYGY